MKRTAGVVAWVVGVVVGLGEGVATAAPVLATSTPSVEFFEAPVGGIAWGELAAQNTGDAPLTVTNMTITGPDASQFWFDAEFEADPLCPHDHVCDTDFPLAPGGSRTVFLRCEPTTAGALAATLTITSTAGTKTVGLTCEGVPVPNVVWAPATLTFPPTAAETGSSQLTLTLTNTAPGSELEFQFAILDDPGTAFTLDPACACGLIEGGTSQVLTITFHPTNSQTFVGPLRITTTDPDQPIIDIPIFAQGQYRRLVFDEPATGSLDLGPSPVGTSVAGTIVAHNDSDLAMRITGAHGEEPWVTLTSGPIPAPGGTILVAPHEVLTWTVTCTPQELGVSSGTVFIFTNGEPDFHLIDVRCEGVGPTLAADPAVLDFAGVAVGSPVTLPVTVRALGYLGNVLEAITSTNPRFTAALATGTLPADLAPSGSVVVNVTFTPVDGAVESGELTFVSPNGDDLVVPVTGDGLLLSASVSPTTHDFGTVPAPFGASAPFVLAADGGADVTVTSATTGTPAFALAGLAPGTSVPGGGDDAFTIAFTPDALGVHAGTATLVLGGLPDLTVALAGVATDPDFTVETVDATPDDFALDLGAVDVDVGARTQVVRVHNGYATDVQITSCTITGDAGFAVPTCATTVPAGGTADLAVAFDPDAEAAYAATLTIAGTTFATGEIRIALTGTGLDQHVALSTMTLTFPDTYRVPTAAAEQTVSLQNTGTTELALSSIAVTGAGFALVGTPATSLAPGASLELTVAFAPAELGAFTGELVIGNADDPAIARVALAGNGIARPVALAPPMIAFGQVELGDTASRPLIIENQSATDSFVITSLAVSGAGFSIDDPGPRTLAPGASTMFQVRFAPGTSSTATGTVTVYLDADPAPHAVASLTGTGRESHGGGCSTTGPAAPTGSTLLLVLVAGLLLGRRRRR